MIERIKIAIERIFLIYFLKSVTGILRKSPDGIIKIKKKDFYISSVVMRIIRNKKANVLIS